MNDPWALVAVKLAPHLHDLLDADLLLSSGSEGSSSPKSLRRASPTAAMFAKPGSPLGRRRWSRAPPHFFPPPDVGLFGNSEPESEPESDEATMSKYQRRTVRERQLQGARKGDSNPDVVLAQLGCQPLAINVAALRATVPIAHRVGDAGGPSSSEPCSEVEPDPDGQLPSLEEHSPDLFEYKQPVHLWPPVALTYELPWAQHFAKKEAAMEEPEVVPEPVEALSNTAPLPTRPKTATSSPRPTPEVSVVATAQRALESHLDSPGFVVEGLQLGVPTAVDLPPGQWLVFRVSLDTKTVLSVMVSPMAGPMPRFFLSNGEVPEPINHTWRPLATSPDRISVAPTDTQFRCGGRHPYYVSMYCPPASAIRDSVAARFRVCATAASTELVRASSAGHRHTRIEEAIRAANLTHTLLRGDEEAPSGAASSASDSDTAPASVHPMRLPASRRHRALSASSGSVAPRVVRGPVYAPPELPPSNRASLARRRMAAARRQPAVHPMRYTLPGGGVLSPSGSLHSVVQGARSEPGGINVETSLWSSSAPTVATMPAGGSKGSRRRRRRRRRRAGKAADETLDQAAALAAAIVGSRGTGRALPLLSPVHT